MRCSIATLQRREVNARIRVFIRCHAFGATRTLTPEVVKKNPKPSNTAVVAGLIEDLARFTLNFNRCSNHVVLCSSTRSAARFDFTKTRMSSAYRTNR